MVRRKQPSEKLAGIEAARSDARAQRVKAGLPERADVDVVPVSKLRELAALWRSRAAQVEMAGTYARAGNDYAPDLGDCADELEALLPK